MGIQNRTSEFSSIVAQAKRQQKQSASSSRQSLLTPQEKAAANGSLKQPRSAFAQQAGAISKEIGVTLERLQRLGALARSRSMFQDNSVEVVSAHLPFFHGVRVR